MVKKDIKNDSDSEDEGKKTRQRFKSERPKEQHKIEKHEPSMLINTSVLEALRRAVTKILRPGISLACVAWRFWLGALSNKGGRGQRNREEIGAEAT